MKKKSKSLNKETKQFISLLEGASRSARAKARRKKMPVAISEEGEVKLIYPDKGVRVISKAKREKQAS